MLATRKALSVFLLRTKMDSSFYTKSAMKDDSCLVLSDTQQTQQPGEYRLQNFFEPQCGTHNAASFALAQPLVQFKDGYGHSGHSGCAIHSDSNLRHGSVLTANRAPQQLQTRLHLTVPYMGRGIGDPCTESGLKEGVSTSSKRQCNTLAEIHIGHQYTPLVDCLKHEIQNPVHILHEDNKSDWIRGGYPSRQWVRNIPK